MDRVQRRNFMNALVNVFPDEIITDILSRIPVQEVVQLKLVCLKWKEIIESRFFIQRMHLRQMKAMNRLFFIFQREYGFWPLAYNKPRRIATRNIRAIIDGDNETEILGTCDGLVLVSNLEDNFWLWNPSTGDNSYIPHSLIAFPEDSNRCAVFFGIGNDYANDDYKIVRIVMFSSPVFKTEVQIFSRNLNLWYRIGDFPYEYPLGMPGLFVHGRLHWQITMGQDNYAIASLDCHTEEYGLIRFPQIPNDGTRYYDIGSLDDERLVIYPTFCKTFESMNLFILDDYGNDQSWRRVLLPGGFEVVPEHGIVTSIQPLYISKPDNRTILFRINPWGTFVEYDTVMGTYSQVEAPDYGCHFCTVFRVNESLVNSSM